MISVYSFLLSQFYLTLSLSFTVRSPKNPNLTKTGYSLIGNWVLLSATSEYLYEKFEQNSEISNQQVRKYLFRCLEQNSCHYFSFHEFSFICSHYYWDQVTARISSHSCENTKPQPRWFRIKTPNTRQTENCQDIKLRTPSGNL